ncbi:MAG: B12-binding domain-containing radical SAM protein [Deltaproteobacteria bacterium]|nr:B12-binding domain-containing radical SAM protein [Deltaproteobacteria bacterium]
MHAVASDFRVLLLHAPSYEVLGNVAGRPWRGRSTAHILGLGYLRGAISDIAQCVVLDVSTRPDPARAVEEHLSENRYDLIGLSAIVFSLGWAQVFAQIARRTHPRALVVLGGASTTFPISLLWERVPDAHGIVVGEGELALRGLVEAMRAGNPLDGLPGIVWSGSGHERPATPSPQPEMDALEFPRPALGRTGIDLHPPYGLYAPIAPYETSRGCPWPCSFCTIRRGYRKRSVERCAGELATLYESRDIREIYFVDPTFTLDAGRTRQLCEAMIARKTKLRWSCKTRVDCVDDETLALMKRAGCYQIALGVESGDEEILRATEKGSTPGEVVEAIRKTNRHGIKSIAYMIVGHPLESEATLARSQAMLREAKPTYASVTGYVPIGVDEPTFAEYWRGVFDGTLCDWPRYRVVARWVRNFYLTFYLRPRTVWTILMFLAAPRGMEQIVRAAFDFARKAVFSSRKPKPVAMSSADTAPAATGA